MPQNWFNFRVFCILIGLILPFSLSAQVDLTGQINDYSGIVTISNVDDATHLQLLSATEFSTDDAVLIIQMKGASINLDDSDVFGTILSYNDCGNFEFSRIASIEGNVVHLEDTLCRIYDVDGIVQLIRVPEHESATVTGTVFAQDWNGTTGGVIVLDIIESLTLEANLDATGSGFRGGTITNNPDGGCGPGSPSYFYDPNLDDGLWWDNGGGAEKGEGITLIPAVMMAGKGPLANGGGGGNKHNNGGGGGANYTAGGIGGGGLAGCGDSPGLGGLDLQTGYEFNKLFMGGGGGCGDDNNYVGSPGTNGGGIIIIRADTIIGNGFSFISNGIDQLIVGGGIADGAGGGGAGGAIYVLCSNYVGDLSLVANGGDGGDQAATYSCVGPGGGGGTGAVLGCETGFSEEVSIELLAGEAGVFLHGDHAECPFSSYGAEDGGENEVGAIILEECLWSCIYAPLDTNDTEVIDTIVDPPINDTTIVAESFKLEMPNVFTPNEDGFNDVFLPITYLGITSAELRVIDRWGVTLFVTENLEAGWDGQFKGKLCTEGVYFWTIIYSTASGEQNAGHGFFHLQ